VPCGTSSTALELLVLADIGGDHLPHLARAQQEADARIVRARVVADDGEVPGASALKRADQIFRDAGEPETAHHDGRAIADERNGFVCVAQNFPHRTELYCAPLTGHVRSARNHWRSRMFHAR
jgi:hypothetical protein